MRYQNLAQIAQAGGWLLGLVMLSACVTTTPPAEVTPALPCPSTSDTVSVSLDQATDNTKNLAMMLQALQKRLQERERTIATQTQQIGVLSSQLEALKQIDQEMNRPPQKRLIYPIP